MTQMGFIKAMGDQRPSLNPMGRDQHTVMKNVAMEIDMRIKIMSAVFWSGFFSLNVSWLLSPCE